MPRNKSGWTRADSQRIQEMASAWAYGLRNTARAQFAAFSPEQRVVAAALIASNLEANYDGKAYVSFITYLKSLVPASE